MLGLLSAGLSAVVGKKVVLQEGGAASSSIQDVLKQTYSMKPPGFTSPSPNSKKFPILGKGFFGTSTGSDFGFYEVLTLQVTEWHSVLKMKLPIQERVKIVPAQFDLVFRNRRLDDDRIVRDYGLQPESTIYLVLRLKGDSRTRRHMWVEFVGSLLCSQRFFSGYSGFPLSSKTNI